MSSKVAELEAEIAYEKLVEQRAKAEAEAEARRAADERKAAEAQFGRQVADLEKSVPSVLSAAAEIGSAAVPSLGVRSLARRVLTGAYHEIDQLAAQDGAVALLNAKVGEVQQLLAHHLEVSLGSGHPLCRRGAAVECQLWRAFTGRLREVAGEV